MSTTLYHLEIHAWMETQQTLHGVRHDDYGQYHAYCSRRLSRLSHEKDAKSYLIHSSKYATAPPSSAAALPENEVVNSKSNNKEAAAATAAALKKKKKSSHTRHAFCSRSHDTFALTKSNENNEKGEDAMDDIIIKPLPSSAVLPVPHINILWYLLVSAERCWAHATQLQKSGKSKKQPILKKLKRATHWATLLLEKAKISADDITIHECEAYVAWMSANHAIEQMQYQRASQYYARAMTLCYELSQEEEGERLENDDASGNNHNEKWNAKRLERQDLFVTRADTVLRPLFRYCQYELKQSGQKTMEEPRLASNQSSTERKTSNNDMVVVYREQELVLDNKDLRVLLLKLQSLEQEEDQSYSGNKIKINNENQFLMTLSVLDDALEVVQGLIQGLVKLQNSGGTAVQAMLQQYELWKGYLQSTKTQKVMEHTEKLLTESVNMGPAEKVHLYDALLQHANSLLALARPGLDSTSNSRAVVEEDEFALQVQANILRIRALKTYEMGWFYFVELKKKADALALMEQSALLCKRAREEIAACDQSMPHFEEYLQQMEDLPVKSAMVAIRAAMILQQRLHARKLANAGVKDATDLWQEPISTDRPLLLRLYEFDGGNTEAPIVDLKPIPLPIKPVFYDVAYDYVLDSADSMDVIENFVRQHTVYSSNKDDERKDDAVGGNSKGLFGWLTGTK